MFEPTIALARPGWGDFSWMYSRSSNGFGFAKLRYRDPAKNTDRRIVARALANISAAQPICGTGAPGMRRTRATRCTAPFNGK